MKVRNGFLAGQDNEREAASSLERMVGILDLFTPERPIWTPEEIAAVLGCSLSTAYRYVRTLTQAQLLTQAAGGYILGARIIQLDRQIRQTDPLIEAARPPMARLAESIGENVIVSRLYGDHVICVHEEAPNRNGGGNHLRGLTVPLFRGAVSKMILANLPAHRQKKVMLHYANEIAKSDLGPDWNTFKRKLKDIKQAGYCVAVGEVQPQLTGIAVPLFDADGQIAGSLCVIIPIKRDAQRELPRLLGPLRKTADKIAKGLAASKS